MPPPDGLDPAGWRVAGVAVLMATWWLTEALPFPVTALMPIIMFPVLGIAPLGTATAPYGDPIVFLFLGGFIVGIAIRRWGLHRRLGLRVVALFGATPRRVIGGLLLATAVLSMWISNSAAAIAMLPVAVSILDLFERRGEAGEHRAEGFATALMLAVAYGASIGGLATIIGTPPNALLVGYLGREHGIDVGFARWMLLGLPLVAIMLVGTWIILLRCHAIDRSRSTKLGGRIADELTQLGAPRTPEIRVAIVFTVTVLAWMLRPLYGALLPGVHDAVIAVMGAMLLFILPAGDGSSRRLIVWADLKDMPWGVLILFGGGLALADAINSSGLSTWIAQGTGAVAHWPVLALVVGATLMMIFLTELTSNTASAALFLPIGGTFAIGLGLDPMTLTVPLALAASCGFMLPVGTPPNAVAFSTGRITMAQMARAGFWVNLLASAVIVGIGYPLSRWLFAT